ncbi:hypothetical protein C8R45DRAFT_1215002 [Mycena sanguinolenta]|nr:hypothetical protein C8R45DRAFT_1215002 [Mycena sanguinolenta]
MDQFTEFSDIFALGAASLYTLFVFADAHTHSAASALPTTLACDSEAGLTTTPTLIGTGPEGGVGVGAGAGTPVNEDTASGQFRSYYPPQSVRSDHTSPAPSHPSRSRPTTRSRHILPPRYLLPHPPPALPLSPFRFSTPPPPPLDAVPRPHTLVPLPFTLFVWPCLTLSLVFGHMNAHTKHARLLCQYHYSICSRTSTVV